MLVFIEKNIDLKDFKCKKVEPLKKLLFASGEEKAFQTFVWFYNQNGISQERLMQEFCFVPQFVEKIKKGDDFYLWFKDFSNRCVKVKKLKLYARRYMPFEKITIKFDEDTQALIEKIKEKGRYETLKNWVEDESKSCEGFTLTRLEEIVELFCTDILDQE